MRRFLAWLLGWPREADMTGGHERLAQHAPAAARTRAARQASRRLLAQVLAVALSVAGIAGIVAVLEGSFGREDARVLATSLGFAVFSATAAAGAALRRERPGLGGAVGVATIVLSALSLLLLVSALSSYDVGAARAFGVTGLLALAGSHTSIVVRARRSSDSAAIHMLGAASILLATFDGASGALLVSGNLRVTDPGAFVRAGGVVVIAMLVTTALPPILRVAAWVRPGERPVGAAPPPPPPPPPPPGSPMVNARVGRAYFTPGMACVLGLVVAFLGYMSGQATGPRTSWAYPAARSVEAHAQQPPAPTYPPPVSQAPAPAPVAPASVSEPPPEVVLAKAPAHIKPGKARPLGSVVQPVRLFGCPAHSGTVEVGGPSGRVQVRRSARGLCVRFRADHHLAESLGLRLRASVMSLRFVDARSPGYSPRIYEVRLTSLGSGPDFSLEVLPPGGPLSAASFGNLGVARHHVSVLIERPWLPGWVLDLDRSTWDAGIV